MKTIHDNSRILFEETYSAVTVNKVRSGLTMLGIVIGIASVIALVAVGQGTQSSIQSSIQSLRANLILMTPGAQRTFGSTVSAGRGSSETLTPDDATAISRTFRRGGGCRRRSAAAIRSSTRERTPIRPSMGTTSRLSHRAERTDRYRGFHYGY